ncbi:sensor histidine kinase [Nocardioides astragali]|uniref:histidine kinase n=1 Tax=Nocardioides astragali TaxID=1776736 RepID=A0ABW2N103_9ACTN|nr:histidine kinase [Nocardioides astragali]
MPVKGLISAGSILPVALAAVSGVVITTAVSVARLSPSLGTDRHSFGVLTLDDLHEGQVELAAAMVLILAAAVLWERVRRVPTRGHLLLFAALCTLAVDNLVSALFTAGFDSLSTSRFATWATSSIGLVAVVLLLLAAWLPDERLVRPRLAVTTTMVATGGVVGLAVTIAWVFRGVLPAAFDTRPDTPEDLTLLSEHPSLFVGEVLASLCCLVAGLMFTRAAHRRQDDLTGWLGVASVLLAVSYANYALVPSHFTELLFLGDYFFLTAVAVLLVGAAQEVRAAEAALVDSALYGERRRIARELHDGVAQELAFIGTQTHTITSARDPQKVARATHRIQESVDRALDQSRSAIKLLSGPVDESLAATIEAAADVVSRRTGAHVSLDLDRSIVVTTEVRAALARITREAISTAARVGGADKVRIDLWTNGSVGLRIVDDGSGLDPHAGPAIASALASIRESAEAVNGSVTIETGDGTGTTVEVRVP